MMNTQQQPMSTAPGLASRGTWPWFKQNNSNWPIQLQGKQHSSGMGSGGSFHKGFLQRNQQRSHVESLTRLEAITNDYDMDIEQELTRPNNILLDWELEVSVRHLSVLEIKKRRVCYVFLIFRRLDLLFIVAERQMQTNSGRVWMDTAFSSVDRRLV